MSPTDIEFNALWIALIATILHFTWRSIKQRDRWFSHHQVLIELERRMKLLEDREALLAMAEVTYEDWQYKHQF